MERLCKILLAISFALSAVIRTDAQESAQGKQNKTEPSTQRPALRYRGNPALFITYGGVRDKLKITDDQYEAIMKIDREETDKRSEAIDKNKNATPQEIDKFLKPINDAFMEAISKTLKPEQIKRFNELAVQESGPEGLCEPDFQRALNLTAIQKQKLNELREEGWKQLVKSGFRPGIMFKEPKMKQFAAVWKEQTNKAVAVLTEDQRTIWKSLTGELIELKFWMVPGPASPRAALSKLKP